MTREGIDAGIYLAIVTRRLVPGRMPPTISEAMGLGSDSHDTVIRTQANPFGRHVETLSRYPIAFRPHALSARETSAPILLFHRAGLLVIRRGTEIETL